MRCKKCGYMSFDHSETCENCGHQFYKDQHKTIPVKSHKDSSSLQYNPESLHLPPLRNETSNCENQDEGSPENPIFCPESSEGDELQRIKTDMHLIMGGFWKRSLAFTIDIFLIGMLQSILSLAVKLGILTGALVMDMTPDTFFDLRVSMIRMIKILIIGVYFIYFHGTTGQTPGKWILRLRVIRTDGKPVGLIRSTNRFIGYLISALPLCMGFMLIAFNHKKQGLHDFVCHTYVIKTM